MTRLSRSAVSGCFDSGDALEGQSGGKESLDHVVVEVPGQAIPIVEHGQLLDSLVEPSVLDGDARPEGQGHDQGFVISRELGPADLVGEVEIPVDLISDLDRHPQERGHRRVVGREAESCRGASRGSPVVRDGDR